MVTAEHLPLTARVDALDWSGLRQSLDSAGYALTDPILLPEECAALIGTYSDDEQFRKRIVMERYRYGVGDYAYFSYPLPPLVQALRASLYACLVPIANEWGKRMIRTGESDVSFPESLTEFLGKCHAAGQLRPTPLLLQYEASGYNCLHQDLYGKVVFPLQATFFLSRPEKDYRGGEFLLVENRPRQQSRGTAVLPELGSCVIFPSSERPILGSRGTFRAKMRHGVSTVTRGTRYTLGIIFHDAE